jgi:hypothetical protein
VAVFLLLVSFLAAISSRCNIGVYASSLVDPIPVPGYVDGTSSMWDSLFFSLGVFRQPEEQTVTVTLDDGTIQTYTVEKPNLFKDLSDEITDCFQYWAWDNFSSHDGTLYNDYTWDDFTSDWAATIDSYADAVADGFFYLSEDLSKLISEYVYDNYINSANSTDADYYHSLSGSDLFCSFVDVSSWNCSYNLSVLDGIIPSDSLLRSLAVVSISPSDSPYISSEYYFLGYSYSDFSVDSSDSTTTITFLDGDSNVVTTQGYLVKHANVGSSYEFSTTTFENSGFAHSISFSNTASLNYVKFFCVNEVPVLDMVYVPEDLAVDVVVPMPNTWEDYYDTVYRTPSRSEEADDVNAGVISIPVVAEQDLTDAISDVITGENTWEDSYDQVFTDTDARVNEKDKTDEKDSENESESSTVTDITLDGVDTSWAGKFEFLKTKFPFCIPYDVYCLFSGVSQTAEAPVFHFKFDFTWINYTWEFTVDLSDYEEQIKIFRDGFFILFLVGLAFATSKVIKWV